jgi:hypothetical protein
VVNFVLRARAQNHGKNPAWTSYEKLRSVIEKRMFSSTEDLLPVISFNAKASSDEQKKHQDFVKRMIRQGLHRQAGAAAGRVVSARGRRRDGSAAMSQLVDRRLSGKNRSAVNRQRFLRRFKGRSARPWPKRCPAVIVADLERGEKISIPSKDFNGARSFTMARAAGATSCIRATRSSSAATGSTGRRAAPVGAAAKVRQDGEGMDEFVFELSKEEFMEFFFQDLALPDLVKKQLAAVPETKRARAGFVSSGQSRQPACGAFDEAGHRPPAGHGRRSARSAARSGGSPGGPDRRRQGWTVPKKPRSCARRSPALKARIAAVPYIDTWDLRYANRVDQPTPSQPGGDVLPAGCVRLHGRGPQEHRQALLHAALPVPDQELRAHRTWCSSAITRWPWKWTRKTSSTPAKAAARWCPAP